MKPLLSVVLPTYNPSQYIFEAVESLLNQENFDTNYIEIIVVDDHSNRLESLAILKRLDGFNFITVVSLPENGGPSNARNIGIKKAKGVYIGFIDDDDLWPLNKLSIQLEALNNDLELIIVGGQIQYFLDGNVKDPIEKYHTEEKILYHVHVGACLMRSALFENTLFYFDQNLRLSEDWDWWLKIKEKNINHLILDAPTLCYRVHKNNTSTQLSIKELGLLKVLKSSLDRRRDKNTQAELLPRHIGEKKMYEITVVIPLYNGASYIQRAIDSVLNQTFPIKQVIVIDDGSTDTGLDLIKTAYPLLQIIEQKNTGVANARNKGWKAATTNWVAFIDQDDEWLPNKIEKQIKKAKENKKTNWIGCFQRFESIDGHLPSFIRSDFKNDHLSQVPSAWLIRKDILESLNGFNEKYRYGSDLDLLRRYRSLNFKEENCSETLLIKHFTGENETISVKESVKDMLKIIHDQINQKK